MARNEVAAIGRAVIQFSKLEPADRAQVLERLSKGKPHKGLVGMAYVEEIDGELSPNGHKYLLSLLRESDSALNAPAPTDVPPTPTPVK